MFLETTDAVAVLAYAGLGATAHGTEPSDWMSSVLRGRNVSLEHSLGILAEALKREMPAHLLALPRSMSAAHAIVVPALVDGEARLYTIELALEGTQSYRFRHTRWVVDPNALPLRPPRFALAGSGATYLQRHRDWQRRLLSVIRAFDAKKVQPRAVADELARISNRVSQNLADETVGPRSIVACRHAPTSSHGGGGNHWFYSGTVPDRDCPSLPTIGQGMDISALAELLMPRFMQQADRWSRGEAETIELDMTNLDAELATMPDAPDETLR
jgi:hypothetical protein